MMKMTHIEALEVLATGDEDRAWAIAQQDEGLLPGVTKGQWLAFAYGIKRARSSNAPEPESMAITATTLAGKHDPKNQPYTAMLVKDGASKRLFVFNPNRELVAGVLGYKTTRYDSAGPGEAPKSQKSGPVVPAARFVLKIGVERLQCHEELLADYGDATPDVRNRVVLDYLRDLWLMLPESAVLETHGFYLDGGDV